MFELCIMATSSLWQPLIFRQYGSSRVRVVFPAMVGVLEFVKTAKCIESCLCSPRVFSRLEELACDSSYFVVASG